MVRKKTGAYCSSVPTMKRDPGHVKYTTTNGDDLYGRKRSEKNNMRDGEVRERGGDIGDSPSNMIR